MLTPASFSQRPHFNRLALAVASSSEPAVGADPSRLSGPGLRSLAGGLDTSGSSAFSSDTPAATSIAIGDSAGRFPRMRGCPALSAKSPTTQGGMHARAMLSRFVRCEEIQDAEDQPDPLTGRRRLSLCASLGGDEGEPIRSQTRLENMPGSETIPPYTVPDARADSRERPAPGSAVNLIPLRRSCWLRASDWKTVSRGGLASPRTDSPVMGNMSSCGGVESRHAPMLMLGDGGKPKTGPTSLLLLRTGAFRGRGILVGAEQSTPSPALKHKLPSLAGLASGPHEHPWSPDSDPPPMCDEENPTFGNNPNKPQDLT